MNSLLIVEGKSDKDIIEHLINFMSFNNIEIGKPICNIDKCEPFNGTGELKKKLNALSRRVKKESISKVGIIFDADKVGIRTRTNEIEETIQVIFGRDHNIEFKIHILNVNGYGELEDILQKITSFPPIMANCLNTWQECLEDKKLDDKELNKLWIQVYQKYDCCTKEEQKNMRDNCNPKTLLEDKRIYDFNKDIKELNKLKKFLQELGE